jgi:thiol-disulfide isomerase/thioredoxin
MRTPLSFRRVRARLCLAAALVAVSGLAVLGGTERDAAAQSAKRRAWLGVELQKAPQGGVIARHVIATSPAAKAGIEDGDVLKTVDGAHLHDPSQLVARVAMLGPGGAMKLRIRRGKVERDVSLALAPFPGTDQVVRLDKVGTFAPTWTKLSAVAGAVPATISAARGKVVVLDFWATWCAPCRLMSPQLSKWQASYGAQGLLILGITSDPVDAAARGVQALDMRYAIASDVEDSTAATYGVRALPTFFVIDKRGVIRDVVVGYDPSSHGRIEKLIETLLAEPAPS